MTNTITFDYIKSIWQARFFWTHLTFAELRTKYRRSTLGMGWSIVQPFAMTMLLSFVMGKIFHSSIIDYAPYIFSGLITWEFIASSANAGCSAFINAESYIKQCAQPLIIYPLKNVLATWINFLFAFVGLIIWVLLWKPSNFGLSQLSLLLAFPIAFFVVWPLAIITAFIGTIFRDFQQLITLILQAIWYISPVFFQPKVFIAGHLEFLLNYNPIYHLLNLFRASMLTGSMPRLIDFIFSIATGTILWLIAWLCIKTREHKISLYL